MYNIAFPNEIRYYENGKKLEDYQTLAVIKLSRGIEYLKDGLF